MVQMMRFTEKTAGRSRIVPIILSVLLSACSVNLIAQTLPSREYQVKAVFLFRFTQFVEWPSRSFPDKTTPLVIGILGEDPFGTYLDDVVRGERVNNRPLVVQRYRRAEDVKICHVLYVSPAAADGVEQISARLKGRNILTVGETATFVRSGGMIGFATDSGKLQLTINAEAARGSGLRISSKLLRIAEIISPGRH
jgi:hypothetical protein